jgi:hypothetical protein
MLHTFMATLPPPAAATHVPAAAAAADPTAKGLLLM